MIGLRIIGEGAIAGTYSRLRHPERSRSSGGAKDLAWSAAMRFAEELDFGWRSAFSAAITPLISGRALVPEVAPSRFTL